MLKPYNGFTGQERDAAQRVINRAWQSGEKPRPTRCALCGQGHGIIDAHLEDYSRPLDYLETCFVCHMMIHCRFRNADRWDEYLALLHDGARFPAFTRRDFPGFARAFLDAPGLAGMVIDYGPPRPSLWADALSVHRAA